MHVPETRFPGPYYNCTDLLQVEFSIDDAEVTTVRSDSALMAGFAVRTVAHSVVRTAGRTG